jgi:CheY-like chemotaxis protein
MTSEHIILCTDSEKVAGVVSGTLDPARERMTVCDSGMELLGTVRALASDLVILDLDTHGLGGLLLISAIQELVPGLPIVAVSADPGADSRPVVQKGIPYVCLGAGEVEAGSKLRGFVAAARRRLAISGTHTSRIVTGAAGV